LPDLKAIDFSCSQKVRMFDPHADLVGDITAAFKAYSHEDVLDHMLKSLKYFRPDIEEELIRRVLALFESFACLPGSTKGDVRR
jgi:hypothetical protein